MVLDAAVGLPLDPAVGMALDAAVGLTLDGVGEGPGHFPGQPPPVLVAEIDDARSWALAPLGQEQPALGEEVLLHRRVEVQVVLGEVGEDDGREGDRTDPLQCKGVGGDLHRTGPVARVEHRPQVGLQVDRLGRGAEDRPVLPADDRLHRPQQAALHAARFQQRPHQICRGGLAVGARHPEHGKLPRGIAVEARRHRPHRCTGRSHEDLRHTQAERTLDHQRRRTCLHRLHSVVVAIAALAGHAEEQRTRPHPAAVIGEVCDLHRRVLASEAARAQFGGNQIRQPHRRSRRLRIGSESSFSARRGPGDTGRPREPGPCGNPARARSTQRPQSQRSRQPGSRPQPARERGPRTRRWRTAAPRPRSRRA